MNIDNYDSRKYPICAPLFGTRGADARRFVREFPSGAQAIEVDADHLMDESLTGMCRLAQAPV